MNKNIKYLKNNSGFFTVGAVITVLAMLPGIMMYEATTASDNKGKVLESVAVNNHTNQFVYFELGPYSRKINPESERTLYYANKNDISYGEMISPSMTINNELFPCDIGVLYPNSSYKIIQDGERFYCTLE